MSAPSVIPAERHAPWEVRHALWNPRMDLLALASVDGQVALERALVSVWKKAWQVSLADLESASGRGADKSVEALVWSPDGRVLAVGTADGFVFFLDTETGDVLHSFRTNTAAGVQTLSWSATIADGSVQPSTSGCATDVTTTLPAFSDEKERKTAVSSSYYEHMSPSLLASVLAVGRCDGRIELVAAGLLPLLIVDLKSLTGIKSEIHIEDLWYSSTDRQLIVAFIADFPDKAAFVSKVDTSACAPLSSPSVSKLTSRYASLVHTLAYIGQVYEKLRDSWEDLLHEIDAKLVSFAREKLLADGGCVGDDLLVLLLLGTASTEMETFLLHTLGEKGVKKATAFIDTAYRKLLDLLALHLQSAAAALVRHSAQLAHDWNELSRDNDGAACRPTLQAAVELALKASEMRTVTALSRRQLSALFRWLHYALLTINKEHVPPELSAIDGDFLVEFIRETFMVEYSGDTSGRPLFRLEKVGQYLESGPLPMPLSLDTSPWTALHASLLAGAADCVFKCDGAASLADTVANVDRAVNAVVEHISLAFADSPKLVEFARAASLSANVASKMQFFARKTVDSSSVSVGVCTLSDRSLLTISTIAADGSLNTTMAVDWLAMGLVCCDFDYYKDEQCFVIVRQVDDDEHRRVRLSFDQPFPGVSSDNSAVLGSGDYDGLYVSGPRCVGMVLSQSRTHVKLFDTEPDDSANRSSLSAGGIAD